jgi:hypothetical protein
MNCNKPGHWIARCWAKRGGAEGQRPHQKKQKKRDSEKKDKKKDKEKASQAVQNKLDNESKHSDTLYMATNTPLSLHYQFCWILNGSATTYICKDRSAFLNFVPHCDIIGGINKEVTSLEVLSTGDINVIITIDGQRIRPLHSVIHLIALMPQTT